MLILEKLIKWLEELLPYRTVPVKTLKFCLCTPDKEQEAKDAGADYVGLDEYIEKLKAGWTDVDVIITMPALWGKLVL